MQEDTFNNFLQKAAVEKYIQGMYLIYLPEFGCEGIWFEYHRKHKRITGGCGFPLSKLQLEQLDSIVQDAFHKILKEKSDAKATYWAEYIDYEEVYGLDNGWN